MSRKEFNAKTREQALERAQGKCENKACGAALSLGKYHFDHILPDALGGKPELANCMVLCLVCHTEKTAKEDVPRIRKADRQRRAHVGAKPPPVKPIRSAGFSKVAKPSTIGKFRIEKPPLPARRGFE